MLDDGRQRSGRSDEHPAVFQMRRHAVDIRADLVFGQGRYPEPVLREIGAVDEQDLPLAGHERRDEVPLTVAVTCGGVPPE
ncbi:hypothetical protein [Thauera sp. SDU_THAU2]|uniref:hypothetical protein n=1 Tax=Thauera sp. SDU_THAU2 TaxID=3136633 RepID=UPI00311FD31A